MSAARGGSPLGAGRGRVEALWIKRALRGPMDAVGQISLAAGRGIHTDANLGRRIRQVTVIEKEVFDRIGVELSDAHPAMRRANIMLSGVRLRDSRDHVLTLGQVRLLIRGETRPCERMEEQCDGLRAALEPDWNGGVYAVVLNDGIIRVGDDVWISPPEASAPPVDLSQPHDRVG